MFQKHQTISLAVLLSLGLASVAHSDELMNNDDEWRFSVAPYIWAASVRGDVGHPEWVRILWNLSFLTSSKMWISLR